MLTLICAALAALPAAAQEPAARERGIGLAACAAYYFNATKARPMGEYETLYAAGERAFNGARRLLGRDETDRLVGEAATEMTAITGGNWVYFDRVSARYAAPCAALLEAPH